MEHFTNHSRMILSLTQMVTEEFGAYLITPAHLILGMTRADDTDACDILAEFDIISSKLAPFVKAKQAPAPPADDEPEIELSENIKRVLEMSVDSTRRRNDSFIGTVHLLLGLLRCHIEEIETILHHFDVESKVIIKFAESYLDENASPERVVPEQATHPLYPAPQSSRQTDNLLDMFRRVWRHISTGKDNR